MQQPIRYSGLSLTPDEQAAENGSLALCGGVELHKGALRPTLLGGTTLDHPLCLDDGTIALLLYVHNTVSYQHYIASVVSGKTVTLHWFHDDGSYGGFVHQFTLGVTVHAVTSVGNTLIIIASDGIHYALWSKTEYEYLGQKPPFLQLRFMLGDNQNENYETGGIDVTGSSSGFDEAFQVSTDKASALYNLLEKDQYKPGDAIADIKLEKQSDVTQTIWALINRTNNLITKNGRFYANFMVRYCYRLYDGSEILHSAPVFMPVLIPNNYRVYSLNFEARSGKNAEYQVVFDDSGKKIIYAKKLYLNSNKIQYERQDAEGKKYYFTTSNAIFMYQPRNVALQYFIPVNSQYDELLKWKDIVKSVDVFVTSPITRVDTSQKITQFILKDLSYSVDKILWDSDWGRDWSSTSPVHSTLGIADIPSISDEEYCRKIRNTSTFFKVASLDINDKELFNYTEKDLPIDKSVVENLAMQPQMSDDYKTHNLLFADGVYTYNHRLNLYGVSEQLYAGFGDGMLPYYGSLYNEDEQYNVFHIDKVVTILSTTDGEKIVEASSYWHSINRAGLINTLKFYPDSRATRMVFYVTLWPDSMFGVPVNKIYSFPLTECPELNGAMHLDFLVTDLTKYEVDSFDYKVDDIVQMPSKIYTSEVDNPYFFPVNGINTVGIGRIMGLATTTRALSQGQFGQYPLMAFSSDGIWALQVAANGTYSGIQPISREVCTNPSSITQLDQSVLFATDRALNKIVESTVASCSDVLDGPYFDIASHMPQLLDFFQKLTTADSLSASTYSAIRQLVEFSTSPIDFFQHCHIVYDYKNTRIFCVSDLAPSDGYPNVVVLGYSLLDDAWFTFLMPKTMATINSYPHPIVQFADGSVKVLDHGYDYTNEDYHEGIIVTRTLKFDEDAVPDAITGYIHSLTSAIVPVMWFYGSNDDQNWHYIGRCSSFKSHYLASKSYRYFRIAIYLKMRSHDQYMSTRLKVIRRFSKI